MASSYRQSIKVCFGKPEICDNITLGNPILGPWFLTKLLTQKEARLVFDQFELKLSITGDFSSALDKFLRDETFDADLKYQIDSDDSYNNRHHMSTLDCGRSLDILSRSPNSSKSLFSDG